MSSKVAVRNLNQITNGDTLRTAFEQYGQVLDATVLHDRDTGRSRCIGFVTFSTSAEAEAAIAGLNEQELDGTTILVTVPDKKPSTEGYGFGGVYTGSGAYAGAVGTSDVGS